jgi:hypothetical protein
MAEKSSLKELMESCGTCDGLNVLLALGEPLLPQAATISAALLAMAVAATALVTERKVNHLVFGRDIVGARRRARRAAELSPRGHNVFVPNTRPIPVNAYVNIGVTL